MQRKYFGIVAAIFLLANNLFGQAIDSTLILQEVEVVAQKEKYLVGSKIETIDSIKLEALSGSSIADLIITNLPIYVKQDAGGLSSIHFRGTSANHTAVMFNGININSLTLGQTNLSNIPAFLFDDVKIQYGSSSSLYGTDAIGGSIQLNNNYEWDKGFSTGIQKDIASFHTDFNGLKAGFSSKKFRYALKIFNQKSKNDFPFLNTAVKDFEKDEFIKDTTKNAAFTNIGLLQEINYKISKKLVSHINVWYEDIHRQIQPNMSSNYYGKFFNKIEDKSLRLISGLRYLSGNHKVTTDFGYINDYQLYNNDTNQAITTQSFITNFNYFNSELLKGDFNAGMNYMHIIPEVYAYDEHLKENRIDLFISYKKLLIKKLTSSINLRETIVNDYKSQFTPSIGFNYSILNSLKQKLECKLAIGSSYKIPTFNDRFWELSGNPDLKPEKGLNYEFGTSYQLSHTHNILQLQITAFYLDIDNWIQWLPSTGSLWKPENKLKVQSKGLEFSIEDGFKISKIKFNVGINYSLNKVVLVKDYKNSQSKELGKQLIYTPEHLSNSFMSIDYKRFILSCSASYTGTRFTESYKPLEDYVLVNTSIGKTLMYKYHIFSVNFKVNNMLDKAYQNQERYAMPGRNFAISIKYSINNLNFKKQ